MRAWLTWFAEGTPWWPWRGRAPEHAQKPRLLIVPLLILPVLLLLHVREDGLNGWVARMGLLLLPLAALGQVRQRAAYRTTIALPPGDVDVALVAVDGPSRRARRALRQVFGIGFREAWALTRSVQTSGAEPVLLVTRTEAVAAERLAVRLRPSGLVVTVVERPHTDATTIQPVPGPTNLWAPPPGG